MSIARSSLVVSALSLALVARAAALQLEIDYSYDLANGNFFGRHAAAKAALEKAAGDLGALISTAPGAVTTDVFSGTSGSTTIRFDWQLSFPNPVTNAPVTQPTFTAAADKVAIHAGFRGLQDDSLTGSSIVRATQTISNTGSDAIVKATAAAAGASNAMMPRANGPVMESKSGSFGGAFYLLEYGVFGGSVWFDTGGDNDPATDLTRLNDYWSFDLAQPVAGKFDFYSAALRGMVHALGFGEAEAWTTQADGTTWTGAKARALFGGDGSNLITTNGEIARNLTGKSLYDGSTQIAALAPDLAPGTRRYLTMLDTAFLEDMGYRIIPEPRGALLMAAGAGVLGAGRPRRRFRLV